MKRLAFLALLLAACSSGAPGVVTFGGGGGAGGEGASSAATTADASTTGSSEPDAAPTPDAGDCAHDPALAPGGAPCGRDDDCCSCRCVTEATLDAGVLIYCAPCPDAGP